MITGHESTYGDLPLSGGRRGYVPSGSERAPHRTTRHTLTADGMVQVLLPANGLITDAEARRLAWAMLADLAPDDVIPTPEVVTYLEGQRLAVLRCIADGKNTYPALCEALGWGRRCTERRVKELVDDERVERLRDGNGFTIIRISEAWR